jgi:hypothetical protein
MIEDRDDGESVHPGEAGPLLCPSSGVSTTIIVYTNVGQDASPGIFPISSIVAKGLEVTYIDLDASWVY